MALRTALAVALLIVAVAAPPALSQLLGGLGNIVISGTVPCSTDATTITATTPVFPSTTVTTKLNTLTCNLRMDISNNLSRFDLQMPLSYCDAEEVSSPAQSLTSMEHFRCWRAPFLWCSCCPRCWEVAISSSRLHSPLVARWCRPPGSSNRPCSCSPTTDFSVEFLVGSPISSPLFSSWFSRSENYVTTICMSSYYLRGYSRINRICNSVRIYVSKHNAFPNSEL